MRSIKRDLIDLSILSAFVLAFALAWGGPFVGASPAYSQDQAQMQQQQQAQTFTGTVVRDGGQYVLRDSSGQTYKLDNPDQAKQYEGKTVKVTGTLDQQAMTIHVQNIEPAQG